MEKFNLEKALAGNPVKLRNGAKAFVIHKLHEEQTNKGVELLGYIVSKDDVFSGFMSWNLNGERQNGFFRDIELEIEGMWDNPRSKLVKLYLPAPLAKVQNGNKVFAIYGTSILEFIFDDKQRHLIEQLNNGELFATAEDAQEWINAMRNSRR